MTGKEFAVALTKLIVAFVLFIIVISIVVWYSKYSMGNHYAGLFWGGLVTFVLLSVGIQLALMPVMSPLPLY